MHMGIHQTSNVSCDTIRLNNITYATYKPTVQVGLGRSGTDPRPTLDFWQQLSSPTIACSAT
jgi:hypothetical protein